MSPTLAGGFFTTRPPGKPKEIIWRYNTEIDSKDREINYTEEYNHTDKKE